MNRHKSDLYNIWKYSREVNRLRIHGHSRGSERSGFYIPELRLCMDAGIQMYFEPKFILVTHCHTDHSFALPMILTGISTKPDIYVPNEHIHLFDKFVNSCYQLSKGNSRAKCKKHMLIGAKRNDVIFVKDDYYVKVYNLDHNVSTRGYGIFRIKKKLREEYHGLPGKEIAELRKQGIEISVDIHEPIMAYICDTTIKPFYNTPELLEFPHLFVECTFLNSSDDRHSKEELKNAKHIHWVHLLPIVKDHPEITFHLIHFSARYDDQEIEDFFKDQCENHNLENVSPWLN